MKFCLGCQKELPLSEFYMRTVGGRSYPQSRCRPCYMRNRKKTCGWAWQRPPGSRKAANRREYLRLRDKIIDGKILECARNFLFCHRKSDRIRGREFDLSLEWICEQIAKPCVYCGEDEGRRTLDRIDNSLGHLENNVVTACIRCNLIRGNMPYEAWLALVPAIREVKQRGLFGDWQPRRLIQHQDK